MSGNRVARSGLQAARALSEAIVRLTASAPCLRRISRLTNPHRVKISPILVTEAGADARSSPHVQSASEGIK